jgi:hypothetical protein
MAFPTAVLAIALLFVAAAVLLICRRRASRAKGSVEQLLKTREADAATIAQAIAQGVRAA